MWTYALLGGILSLAMSVAPSFLCTILVDRDEAAPADVSAAREVVLDTSHAIATAGGSRFLRSADSAASTCLLHFPVAGAIRLETLDP